MSLSSSSVSEHSRSYFWSPLFSACLSCSWSLSYRTPSRTIFPPRASWSVATRLIIALNTWRHSCIYTGKHTRVSRPRVARLANMSWWSCRHATASSKAYNRHSSSRSALISMIGHRSLFFLVGSSITLYQWNELIYESLFSWASRSLLRLPY